MCPNTSESSRGLLKYVLMGLDRDSQGQTVVGH